MATNNSINEPTATLGTILQGQGVGTASTFSTATYPATTTANQLLYSSATNTVGGLTSANSGTLVTSNAGVPSILAGPGTTGQVLQSNAAAAPSFSTASYPSTTSINQILYSSAANTVTGLATANNGTLITGTTGIPSVLANGTTGQVLTATTGSPPSWGTSPGVNTVTGQLFTSSGAFTYTPTSGMKFVIVELVGGGGGSGGSATSTATVASAGGGGGGAYARFILTAAQVGVSLSGNIGSAGSAGSSGNNAGGNGGNTTLATSSAWTSGGGIGGSGSAAGATSSANGGAGGTVTTGTGTILATNSGQSGFQGIGIGSLILGAPGGSSQLGRGGIPSNFNNTGASAGAVGSGYGAGASGSSAANSAAQTGSAGTSGAAIFTEFV